MSRNVGRTTPRPHRMGFSARRMSHQAVEGRTGHVLESLQITKIEPTLDDRITNPLNDNSMGYVELPQQSTARGRGKPTKYPGGRCEPKNQGCLRKGRMPHIPRHPGVHETVTGTNIKFLLTVQKPMASISGSRNGKGQPT